MGEGCNYIALQKEHPNKWVALSSDSKRVVAIANTAREACEEAKKKKENNPILTKTAKTKNALFV